MTATPQSHRALPVVDQRSAEYVRREFLGARRLVILSLLQACDLHCVYCRGSEDWYDRLAQLTQHKIFPRESWPRFLQLCADNDVAEVLLTGGEPSLYPHLLDLVALLHEHGVRSALHTHGLTKRLPALLDFVQERAIPMNFHVSVELFEDHQKDLRESDVPVEFVRNASNRGYTVELKMVLHQRLLERIDQIRDRLRWWIDLGARSIRFQPVAPAGAYQELTLEPSFTAVLDLLEDLRANDEEIGSLFRNSAKSFDATRSVLLNTPAQREYALACNIVNQIIFVTTDFSFLDCKSLWSKPQDAPCPEIFDYVCAGYQR
jgi:molybdenum cofactor biosynthesis enzyme MoaA